MIALLARTACVLAIALTAPLPAAAQDYPKKTIELVVPFVAGGTTDNIARLMAQRFSDSWGQTVVVNNRAGGGSTIGTNAVAKAPPDGHTLLVTTIGFAINAGLQKLPYDPIGDFTPVTELASLPLVLVVHASLPVTNLQEFIALAKSKAGGWDYASSGTGTSPHLAAEMFKSMAGIELVHVPFKGNAEAMNSLMGGHVKIYFKDVVAKINGELVRMLNVPDVRRRISQEGADPVGSTPGAFANRVKNEITKWTKVIKTSGIQPSN